MHGTTERVDPETSEVMTFASLPMIYWWTLACSITCLVVYYTSWYGQKNQTRRLHVLRSTRNFLTGDESKSIRDHMKWKSEAFLEDRKLQAQHALRELVSKARQTLHQHAEYQKYHQRSVGDGLDEIYTPLPISTHLQQQQRTLEYKQHKAQPRQKGKDKRLSSKERLALSALLRYEIFKLFPLMTLVEFCQGLTVQTFVSGATVFENGRYGF